MPSVKSYRTLCFERILPYLRSKTDVHITWLVYQPERLKIESQIDPHTSILDIHDFKNAVEVVQQVKPDIIWVAPTLNLPDYALSLAGKHMNVPVVGELVTELMKQKQYSPLSVAEMALSLYAVNEGYLDDVDILKVGAYEESLHDFARTNFATLLDEINKSAEYSDEIQAELKKVCDDFSEKGVY